MPMAQEARLTTLAAIHRSLYAGRQIKEASLSLMFNGVYRAPNKAWQTTIWFATGQKLATQAEAFNMDWGGHEEWNE